MRLTSPHNRFPKRLNKGQKSTYKSGIAVQTNRATSLLTATSARADDQSAFTEAVMKCWNMPAGTFEGGRFVMSVEIDGKGEPIDITAKEFKEGGVARAFGMSLARAVVRCAPYNSPTGVYTITIDKTTFGGKSLDPFK